MKKIRIPYHKSESRSFSPGQNIFTEGDTGDAMYVVLEGNIDLLIHDKVVEKLGPGSVLGEMALLEPAKRSATAIARTECKVVPVNEQRFHLLVQHTPDFALQIMRVMADRLRTMDARL